MYIKSINNVVGYKDLPDGFNIEFNENKTYIVGANFQRKTTVGSLFNWCLTGTSLNGKEKEQVANDTKRVSNVIVDITFVDNFGIEHRLIRDKGKEIHLTLDGKEIKQENLAQFYKNKDIFLVAHNPYYFWTLEPKEQKDLVRNILPIIDSEETFELLNEYEQQVIKEPIENLSSYTDARNADIDRLGKEYNKNIGKIETLRSIALEQEGCLLEFTREQELKDLQEKYESISMNFDNSNLEDLKRNIEGINRRLQEIIKEDLEKISEQYNRENKKLKQVENEHPICPSCRQEIKDNEAGEHLKQFFQKEMNRFQEKANELKETAKKLAEEKKEKIRELLLEHGIDLEALKADQNMTDVDDFDFICHVAFDKKPLTRRERAENVKKRDFLSKYSGAARDVLEALLDKYMNTGIYEIEKTEILRLDPFLKMGKPQKIASYFGGKDGYLKAVKELEQAIYEGEIA